jgi:serine/threonine protein phosphatase 1
MTVVRLAADEPLAIVGDVHGCAGPLRAALEDLRTLGRRIVLVGDYVNRGRDSRKVLGLLAVARAQLGARLVLLRGNHEVALLEILLTGQPAAFLRHRGATTIRSYLSDPGADVLQDFRRAFPSDHLAVLQSTVLCAEGPGLLVAHAGYHPARPSSRTEPDLTSGSWAELAGCDHPPRALTVVGHYVQQSGRPFVSDRLIGIDTGCGSVPGAPLTALLLPERTFRAYR